MIRFLNLTHDYIPISMKAFPRTKVLCEYKHPFMLLILKISTGAYCPDSTGAGKTGRPSSRWSIVDVALCLNKAEGLPL